MLYDLLDLAFTLDISCGYDFIFGHIITIHFAESVAL